MSLDMPTEPPLSKKKGLRYKLSRAFGLNKLSKVGPQLSSPGPSTGAAELRTHSELRNNTCNDEYGNQGGTVLDTQLGELKDNTAYLHSLVYNQHEQEEAYHQKIKQAPLQRASDHKLVEAPKQAWELIISYLEPAEAASLVLTSKHLLQTIGPGPLDLLNHTENHDQKIQFLLPMDEYLPNHLLCFLCASYHSRSHPGQEILKPTAVFNPLYKCPQSLLKPQPKHRITPRRTLQFTFVQLVMRSENYGPKFGVSVDSLARRWSEEGKWSHQTRYAIIKGHLFMRVASSTFVKGGLTPSQERLLLYSREDYTPYFSACAHWRDGLLMELCKCALAHVPVDRSKEFGGLADVARRADDRMKQKVYDPSSIVTLCEKCRPMRRCPECPSEYLIEMKRMEDRATKTFKRAMMVTRWCDLGPGVTPKDIEWAAVNGEAGSLAEGMGYDSLKVAGTRAISGTFEAHLTEDHIPGQMMLNLNPRMEKHSDVDDPAWY